MAKAEKPRDIGIENLPKILSFEEEKSLLLVRTHHKMVNVVRQQGPDKAVELAKRYEQIAQEEVVEPAAAKEPAVAQNVYAKARAGLLIKLAHIWREAGAFDKALEALDRAIAFARQKHWSSIVTALEDERKNLLPTSL